MQRYFDAEKVVNTLFSMRCKCDTNDIDDYYNMLSCAFDVLPTADVVEVVRCKDCEFYDPFVHRLKGNGTCAFWDNMQTGENTFCSHGCKKKTVKKGESNAERV